jgi:hypothetical protein
MGETVNAWPATRRWPDYHHDPVALAVIDQLNMRPSNIDLARRGRSGCAGPGVVSHGRHRSTSTPVSSIGDIDHLDLRAIPGSSAQNQRIMDIRYTNLISTGADHMDLDLDTDTDQTDLDQLDVDQDQLAYLLADTRDGWGDAQPVPVPA